MRLFIAIRLSDEIRNGLAEIQSFLRNCGVNGNFTRLENLHLTLVFIGEYADPEGVLDTMRGISFAPFSIQLDGFGSFGDLYWCGIRENNGLSAYVQRLRRALAENGIPFDRKKFSPHITLIRKASFDKNRGFPGVTVPDVSMKADCVSLMRSDRVKSGMVYTETGRIFR